ncbi:MAG TPA: heparin lyase I family protein [Chloroflexota bacterium]|nr:heparin lyase I family protein [Chloroflexota bacterium]
MRLSRMAALAALLILAAITTSGAQATTIWTADYEGGTMGEWTASGEGSVANSGTGNVSLSSDVAHSGRYSARMTISNASGSSQAVRLLRWGESEKYPDAYYSAYFYFPQNYTGMSWWNVMQWKSRLLQDSSRNDPVFVLNVGNMSNGRMRFYLWNHLANRGYDQVTTAVPVGRWVHVEAYYRQAADNNGRVTIYQDGEQILDVANVATRRPNDSLYWGVGNYTDRINPSTATIYVDDAAISTNRLGPGPAPAAAGAAASAGAPSYRLGFGVLAGILGGLAGNPLEEEGHDPVTGDGLQRTSTGLMVWRKSDNWTAFTNGTTTWVNGPYGVQERANSERFPWESQ